MPEPRYVTVVIRLRLGLPFDPFPTRANVKRKIERLLASHVRLDDEPAWTRTPLSVRVVLFDSSGRPIEQGT